MGQILAIPDGKTTDNRFRVVYAPTLFVVVNAAPAIAGNSVQPGATKAEVPERLYPNRAPITGQADEQRVYHGWIICRVVQQVRVLWAEHKIVPWATPTSPSINADRKTALTALLFRFSDITSSAPQNYHYFPSEFKIFFEEKYGTGMTIVLESSRREPSRLFSRGV